MSYTAEEAEPLVPHAIKKIAMLAIDGMIVLDSHRVNSYEFERYVHALEGSIGHLSKLFTAVCKAPTHKRVATQK